MSVPQYCHACCHRGHAATATLLTSESSCCNSDVFAGEGGSRYVCDFADAVSASAVLYMLLSDVDAVLRPEVTVDVCCNFIPRGDRGGVEQSVNYYCSTGGNCRKEDR